MAANAKKQEGAEQTDQKLADVGKPYGPSMRSLAEDLPEKDEVQEAYKAGFLADSAQAEAKEKVKAVDASPNADATPSGHALKETAGVSHDTKRGEAYARAKGARRWGYVPAEEKDK